MPVSARDCCGIFLAAVRVGRRVLDLGETLTLSAVLVAREGGVRTSEELEIFRDAITGRNITKFSGLVDIARQIKVTGGYYSLVGK